jgi:hypothetical protein
LGRIEIKIILKGKCYRGKIGSEMLENNGNAGA